MNKRTIHFKIKVAKAKHSKATKNIRMNGMLQSGFKSHTNKAGDR